MGAAELAGALKPLWEDAGALVGLLEGRPFVTWTDLIDAAQSALAVGSDELRTAVLRSHPRLGSDPEELVRRSSLSWAEQGGSRRLDAETAARLAELNERYEARFGFPFVEWVAGRPLSAIAAVLEARLQNARAEELEKGCAALVAIARDRLTRLDRPEGPCP